VNIADNVGPAQDEQLVATLLAPEIIGRRVAELNIGPHRAVIHHDAFLHAFEETFHLEETPPCRAHKELQPELR